MTLTTALSFPFFFFSILLHVITAQSGVWSPICHLLLWQILAWTLSMCSVDFPRGCVGEVTQATDRRCRNWSNNLKRLDNFKDSNTILAFLIIEQHLFCSFMSAWNVTASPPLKDGGFGLFLGLLNKKNWNSQIKLLYKCNWTQREHCCCSQ